MCVCLFAVQALPGLAIAAAEDSATFYLQSLGMHFYQYVRMSIVADWLCLDSVGLDECY